MFSTLRSGAKMLLGALALFGVSLLPAQATETILKNFSTSYTSGAYPVGQLALISGVFYGATQYGINGYGDLFKMTTSGAVTTLHEFAGGAGDGYQPWSGPIVVSGNLYGTTAYGGTQNAGILYKMTPSGTFTILHSFTGQSNSDGANPYAAPFLASDGNLYGTTDQGGVNNQGTVWQYNLSNNTYTVLHSFLNTSDTAYNPITAVVEGTDGVLYGTAYNASGFNSGIYKINKNGSGYSFVHGFNGSDAAGYNAYCDLILANDGNLYGITDNGGANGVGTVFKVVTSTGTVTPLWAFDGYTGAYPQPSNSYTQNRLIQGSDHNLYGVTQYGGVNGWGTAFKLTLAGACTLLTSFNYNNTFGTANPLVQDGTSFYCTSFYGGIFALPNSFNGDGAAVSISSTGAIKLLQTFYQRDSWNPYAGLVQDGTKFYGEGYSGGEYGNGYLYSVDASGHFNVLHQMNNDSFFWEGNGPAGGLLLDGTTLYGMTSNGGKFGGGTLFSVTAAGKIAILYQLNSSREGYSPYSALTKGAGTDANLYGTLSSGAPASLGSVFSTNTSGSTFKIIHYFNGPDGRNPECTPVPDGAGNIWGTCYSGGANNYGTIWKLSTNGATFTKVFDFDYTHGANPWYAGHLYLISGILYGTAQVGGANGQGVIWAFNTSTSAISLLHSFNNNSGEGYYPVGLTYDAAGGNFYGCCYGGGADSVGTVWKINIATGTFTKLHDFAGQPNSDGANPYYAPILGSDGFLYGTTVNGGVNNYGMAFQTTTTP